jgi:Arc/MetJ-type ribon-helix-helix transcriptional regulator
MLAGAPFVVRNDPDVNFNWGRGAPAPGMPVDNFSVRWTRRLSFPVTQPYRFVLRSDDGVRLWIDGVLQIDEWHNSGGQTFARDVQLGTGQHAFTIEYFENTGGALVYFTVQRVGDSAKWKGEYFPNDNWLGSPALIRDDDRLDFDWGAGSPDQLIPPDRFSVRWTRTIDLEAGAYRFDLAVDDGVRFWIDNVLVLDKVQVSNTPYSVAATLTAGKHTFRLDYVEFTGQRALQLDAHFSGRPYRHCDGDIDADTHSDLDADDHECAAYLHAHNHVDCHADRHDDIDAKRHGNAADITYRHGDGHSDFYGDAHGDADDAMRRTWPTRTRWPVEALSPNATIHQPGNRFSGAKIWYDKSSYHPGARRKMTVTKIAITLDPKLVAQLDQLVARQVYASRSQAIQAAIQDQLARLNRSRLARECAKLDPHEEQAWAEEGLDQELATWPAY